MPTVPLSHPCAAVPVPPCHVVSVSFSGLSLSWSRGMHVVLLKLHVGYDPGGGSVNY